MVRWADKLRQVADGSAARTSARPTTGSTTTAARRFCFCRLVPGIRSLISIPAGMSRNVARAVPALHDARHRDLVGGAGVGRSAAGRELRPRVELHRSHRRGSSLGGIARRGRSSGGFAVGRLLAANQAAANEQPRRRRARRSGRRPARRRRPPTTDHVAVLRATIDSTGLSKASVEQWKERMVHPPVSVPARHRRRGRARR